MVAQPAQAYFVTQTERWAQGGYGRGETYCGNPLVPPPNCTGAWVNTALAADKYVTNYANDQQTCMETWVDLHFYNHRPPDVWVDCTANSFSFSGEVQMHWPTNAGTPGARVESGAVDRGWAPEVVVCRVNTWNFSRVLGGNCTGAGVDVNSYSGRTWRDLKNPAVVGGMNVPEYLGGSTDLLPQGTTLYSGDHLVSWDGRFNLVMQDDGNFVIYKKNVGAVWSTGTSGNPGARIVLQGDGNLVVYRTNNTAAWASGTFGCCGWHAIMHNDGNFVIRNGGGAYVWGTGPH